MIDWRVSPEFEALKEREWFFPSFEVQEYLLPQINVGEADIDEYGSTTFTSEECLRLKRKIECIIDSGALNRRKEFQFDSIEKGLVTFSCEDIKGCLLRLYDAADLAAKRNGTLVFYGD